MRLVSATLLLGLVAVLSSAPAQSSKSKPSAKDGTPNEPTTVAGKTLGQWRMQLTSKDASKRAVAIMMIAQFGEASSAAVGDLIRSTYDSDISPRSKALYALRIVAVDPKDVPKVVEALALRLDPNPPGGRVRETQHSVRYEAASTLKRFYKDARPAIPALIRGTMDKGSWELRHQCAWVLWRVAIDTKNGPDPAAVDALIDLLKKDSTYLVRLEAIQGLGGMGRPTDSTRLANVVDILTKCASPSRPNPEYRPLYIWGFASLVNIQDEGEAKGNLAKLARYLDPKYYDLEVRVQAAGALASLGAKAKPRIGDLLKMLKDKEKTAVMAAAMALVGIGDTSDKVIDGLLGTVDHKDPATAATAIIALVNLKANKPGVLKKLRAMHADTTVNDDLRKTVGQAIKAFEKKEEKKP